MCVNLYEAAYIFSTRCHLMPLNAQMHFLIKSFKILKFLFSIKWNLRCISLIDFVMNVLRYLRYVFSFLLLLSKFVLAANMPYSRYSFSLSFCFAVYDFFSKSNKNFSFNSAFLILFRNIFHHFSFCWLLRIKKRKLIFENYIESFDLFVL